MAAVSPRTHALSPFVGARAQALADALADLLGLGELAGEALARDGDGLRVQLAQGALLVGGLSPGARTRGEPLTLKPDGLPRAAWRQLAQAVSGAGRPQKAALAAAADAWWPFAGLPDSEFRSVTSSSHGQHGTLRLGYRCNQDCWFCWQDRQGPGPPLSQVERWLDELAAMGVDTVHFTGGEPTAWRELPDLVQRASQVHGMGVVLQTNAIRFARPDYTRRLVQAGVGTAHVSLHAGDAALSDRMTRAPGTFDKTVAGIAQLLGAGVLVTLNCVVEAANHDALEAHARFIVDRFVAPFPDNRIARVTWSHPVTYFQPGGWSEHQLPFDQVRPHLSRAVAILRDAGVPVELGGPCGFPVCALDPATVGDPYDLVRRDLYSAAELVHRRFAPACDGCAHRPRCFGLRQEYLDRFGDRGLVPAPATGAIAAG